MSYASLLTNNATSSSVAAGGVIPLGSAIHGFGKAIKLNGNNINLTDSGYYRVAASASAAVTGTGTLSLGMNLDSIPVAGTASATPGAAGSTVNLTLTWLVRKSCCCDPSALTFTASAACTVTNFTVEVEKV